VDADRDNLHSEHRRYGLNGGELSYPGDKRGIADDSRPRPAGCELPSDPPVGSCNGGDGITPSRAALRDFKPPMSARGQKRRVASGDFCLSPKSGVIADMAALALRANSGREQVQQKPSLDHLVGGGEQHIRHGQA
jgi:hypothetical protein